MNQDIQSFFAEIGQLGFDLRDVLSQGTKGKRVIHSFMKIINQEVADVRVQGKVKYPLAEIVVMVFFGVMAGYHTVAAIQRFCEHKQAYLKRYMRMRHGVPSDDTMMLVLSSISLQQLEAATVGFLLEKFVEIRGNLGIAEPQMPHLCVDGKEARGTGRLAGSDREVRNLQTLHVYDAQYGICLISRQIDKKTNEIPVAQEVLQALDLRGVLVTFDAMHTQKKTIDIIARGKGYFLGGLKGNQKLLTEEVKIFFDQQYVDKAVQDPVLCYVSSEKAHNCLETRQFLIARVAHAPGSVFSDWKHINSVVQYTKTVTDYAKGGVKRTETRYYVTNLVDAKSCGYAVRSHWKVENSLHWHLDVHFGDDRNMTVNRTASGNLTLLKKMALSLYKLLQPFEKKGTSLNMISVDFSASFEDAMKRLLSLCDNATLKQALESVAQKKP